MQNNTPDKPDKQLLVPKEIAAELGVHPDTVRRAIRDGELRALRLGEHGRYRIRPEAIDEFLRPARRERA